MSKIDASIKPWELTAKEFLDTYITGFIASSAYRDYATTDGISWLGSKERYPLKTRDLVIDGEALEFRKNRNLLQYCKLDANNDILRDESGKAVMESAEGIIERKLPIYDAIIVVFNASGLPIAFASDEFGCDGIWVVEDYQRKGIGVKLLTDFRAQFETRGAIGQATNAGINMAAAYHRELVKQAMKEGIPVAALPQNEEELIDQTDEVDDQYVSRQVGR